MSGDGMIGGRGSGDSRDSRTSRDFRDWDAAYVLGALSADDRRTYERLLAADQARAAEVAELAGLPGILSTLSADEAIALLRDGAAADGSDSQASAGAHPMTEATAGSASIQSLARAASARRRRGQWMLAALSSAAASVLVVGALLIGGVTGTGSSPSVPLAGSTPQPSASSTPAASTPAASAPALSVGAVAMSPVTAGVMTADLQVSAKGWGTRFDWTCHYSDAGWATENGGSGDYELVVTDVSGAETTVASWSATSSTSAGGLSASTSVPTASIRSVDIRLAGAATPLVRTVF